MKLHSSHGAVNPEKRYSHSRGMAPLQTQQAAQPPKVITFLMLSMLVCGVVLVGMSLPTYQGTQPPITTSQYSTQDKEFSVLRTQRARNTRALQYRLSAFDPGDTAVIIPWFQAIQYHTPLANMLLIQHKLQRMGIPYFIAEGVLTGETPRFKGLNVFHFHSNVDYLWQDDALIAAATRKLPTRFTKIVWLASDAYIPNSRWLLDVSKMLEHDYHVVQPFESVCYQPANFRGCLPSNTNKGSAWKVAKGCDMASQQCGASGLAVAVRREIVQQLGFLDNTVAGLGDQLLMAAFFDVTKPTLSKHAAAAIRALSVPYNEYRAAVQQLFGEPIRVGYLAGVSINRLYHGTRALSSREELFKAVAASGFSAVDMYRNDDGIMSVTRPEHWAELFMTFYDKQDEDLIQVSDLTADEVADAAM